MPGAILACLAQVQTVIACKRKYIFSLEASYQETVPRSSAVLAAGSHT